MSPVLFASHVNGHLIPSLPASAFESFQLGAGYPTEVSVWTKSFPVPTRKTGRVILNLDKRKVWKEDGPTKGQCLWEMHGVWGWDRNKKAAIALRESYFNKHPMSGKKVNLFLSLLVSWFKFCVDWLVHRLLLSILEQMGGSCTECFIFRKDYLYGDDTKWSGLSMIHCLVHFLSLVSFALRLLPKKISRSTSSMRPIGTTSMHCSIKLLVISQPTSKDFREYVSQFVWIVRNLTW